MSGHESEPLVSVVVPAYNARRTVRATIASIEAQTVEDIEIVLVDDGSTDDTASVAAASGARGLRVITQANAGHAAARNTGIAAARGKYIAFLDADDLWFPQKLERQLAVIRRGPDVRAVQSGAARVDEDLNVLWVEACRVSQDPLWDTLRFRNMPALMSTLLVEKTLLEDVGGFDASLVILQDWDLAIRLAERGQFHSLPEVLAAYRFYPHSQSGSLDIHIEPGFRVLEKVFTDPNLPPAVRARRRAVYGRFYAMLSGGAVRVGRYRDAVSWGVRALLQDPRVVTYIMAFPARRLRRRRRVQLQIPPDLLAANGAIDAGASSSD